MKNKEKYRVLFIAKNIPVQKKESNRIIFDIALNITNFCDIQFLFPKEIVPFWLKNNNKFGYLYKLKSWIFEGFEINPIPYIKLPFKKMQFWAMFNLPKKVIKYLKQNQDFDLVHAHYLLPDGYIAYKIYKNYGIPYVLTFRNQDKQYLELISLKNPDYNKAKKIITSAKCVLTPNLGYKSFVEDRFNVKCQLVPHGIHSSLIENKVYEKLNDGVIITTVGEAILSKNIEWVIQAFLGYNGTQNIKLDIIGDGPILTKLKNIAGDEKRITFLGRIPHKEVIEKMQKSDIFALPSCKETFGMVYLEAASTYNAIIAFKGEGVWGIFKENEEALFCDDYTTFKKHFFCLINNNYLIKNLQKNAYSKVLKLQWSKIKDIYSGIYTEVIKG